MSRILLLLVTAVAMLAAVGCEPAANTNTANKPANNANTNANSTSTANVEAEVKKAMEAMAGDIAKNDADALGARLADDYYLVTPRGTLQNKTERLADMKSGNTKFDSFVYEDIKVRPFGNTAIATATVKAKGKAQGVDVAPQIRSTVVFVKVGNEWKAVSGHATAVADAGAKPANTNANTSNANTSNANAKPATSPANK